ncbi:HNH endonuclease [Tardiphaga sp.]|jgi:hypothetical protein|uniref:HNH endonuclease n=1 Tax=Tardiphaga sp. TaxID=1926292 RepID=UPI0037DA1032
MAREPISKKIRFEVFKRDSFTCQYCGKKAPDVILNCDHINPVVAGGTSDILNLITACFDCNSGKGGRSLSDQSVITKQVDQLAELQARREQIEMMIEWREQLAQLDSDVVVRLEERWATLVEGRTSLTPAGRDSLRKVISRYGVDLTIRAMQESAITYLKREPDQTYSYDSACEAFSKIGSICGVLKASESRPYMRELYYVRGILRKRLSYMNEWQCMQLMEAAIVVGGADVERIKAVSKEVRNWSQFKEIMEAWATTDED